jgi:hypothetical protein
MVAARGCEAIVLLLGSALGVAYDLNQMGHLMGYGNGCVGRCMILFERNES